MPNDKINQILTRSVEKIYPTSESLEAALQSGEKLKIYTGIDPTGRLHIGHLVFLKKLKQFQDLGHDVIILIGDFTARIGDPTDKTATRKKLSKEQIEENAKNYKELIGKILDVDKANLKFLHNEKWSNALKLVDILELASNFTVQQLIERDMFQERLKSGKEIYLHEFLYPVFQAYDSVAMDVDMEVGGNDQTFNMLAGRTLMKKMKNKEKFVLSTKLLVDPTGKKMGKTEGNMVNLDDSPNDMFGKIMSFPDELILVGFELLTDLSQEKIELLKTDLGGNLNPRDAKADLAFEVVKQLHTEQAATDARDNFDKTFRDKQMPEDIREVKPSLRKMQLVGALVEFGLAESKSQAQRLIEQGGVKIDGVVAEDAFTEIEFSKPVIIQVGKLNFVRVLPND